MKNTNVKPAEGRLGIMIVGNGAVATTFMTGVLMARRGLGKPVGSMTQYDKIRVGRGDEKKYLKYSEIVPLASLDDVVFGCWDVYPQNAYQSAVYAEVLKREDVDAVRDELEQIIPMKAAFDRNYAKRLDGDNVKDCKTRWEMVEALRDDIRRFRQEKGCARIVVLWAASTEIYVPVEKSVHYQLSDLETAMRADDRQRAELHRWVDAVDFDRQEKIKAVTALYNEIGIRQLCEEKINFYFNQARQYLTLIDVLAERKQPLIDFTNEMMHRDK